MAARAVGMEVSGAELVQDGFRNDRTGGASRAEKQDIQRTGGRVGHRYLLYRGCYSDPRIGRGGQGQVRTMSTTLRALCRPSHLGPAASTAIGFGGTCAADLFCCGRR